jgi:GntR family transcriptional regulator / MocR family aminotransferase
VLHDGASPPPLYCRDRSQRVIYLSSYNHVTFPGLRVGYMVLPEALVDAFAAVRGMMGDHAPTAVQQALAGFIDEGHLARHLRRMRTLYRERRDTVLAAAARHLSPAQQPGPLLGAVYGTLPLAAQADDAELALRLAAAGLGVEPLSAYSALHPAAMRPRGLVFGYGADSSEHIERAFAQLGRVLVA